MSPRRSWALGILAAMLMFGACAASGAEGGAKATRRPSSTAQADPAIPAPAGGEAQVVSVTLQSSTGGSMLPFTVGQVFKKGDVPSGKAVLADIPESQFIVKNRWPDGSVRFGILSGRVDIPANGARVVALWRGQPQAAGTALTAANLAGLNPELSVSLGSFGTVSLSSLNLTAPVRTWVSGPVMSEFHYRSPVGSDAHLVVWFQVRLYKGGAIQYGVNVENGYLTVANPGQKNYVPEVRVRGQVRWNNNGQSLPHYHHSRWVYAAWDQADPGITPRHDTAYMMASKMVPNVGWRNPTAAAYAQPSGAGLVQTYEPMKRGSFPSGIGSPGYHESIGLLPNWDMLYLASGADPRAYRAVVAHGYYAGSFPIHYRDQTTQRPVMMKSYPNISLYPRQGSPSMPGASGGVAVSYNDKTSHAPALAYLAYLLTGDYWLVEAMQFHATYGYMYKNEEYRGYGNYELNGQLRARAWEARNLMFAAVATPDDDAQMRQQFADVWGYNMVLKRDYHVSGITSPSSYFFTGNGRNTLGVERIFEDHELNTGYEEMATWQHDFIVAVLGWGWDLELPLTAAQRTAHQQYLAHLYKAVVDRLGAGGAGQYCYRYAALYYHPIATGDAPGGGYDVSEPSRYFANWGVVYSNVQGRPSSCNAGSTLLESYVDDSTGFPIAYWANLQPAISYAVDHGATGALEGYQRMTGASNWLANAAYFNDVPNWAVAPR